MRTAYHLDRFCCLLGSNRKYRLRTHACLRAHVRSTCVRKLSIRAYAMRTHTCVRTFANGKSAVVFFWKNTSLNLALQDRFVLTSAVVNGQHFVIVKKHQLLKFLCTRCSSLLQN